MESNNEPISSSAPSAESSPIVADAATTKKSKGLIATTIIAVILAIAGIAASVYFFMDNNNKTAEITNLKSKIDLLKLETGAEFIEKEENGAEVTIVEISDSSQQEVKNIAKQIYDSVSSNITGGRFYTVFSDGSFIKIPGTDIWTTSNESYGVISEVSYYDSSIEKQIMDTAYSYAKEVLSNNGFVETKDEISMSTKLFYNSNTSIYCMVSESSLPFRAECSKDTWISDEDKELVVSLAKNFGYSYIAAKSSNIKNSSVSPYQRLTANGAGAALLFYRVSPNSEWQFFTATQAELLCSDYDTNDLKNAFAGERCWDSAASQESKVQP